MIVVYLLFVHKNYLKEQCRIVFFRRPSPPTHIIHIKEIE